MTLNCLTPEIITFFKQKGLVFLVFKPVCELVVHQLAGFQDEVSIFNYQIRYTFVEVSQLWDLSFCKKLIKVVDLFSDCVVFICNLKWSSLKLFRTLHNAKVLDADLLTYCYTFRNCG